MSELWSKNKAIILFGALVLAPLSVVADWDGQCRGSNGGGVRLRLVSRLPWRGSFKDDFIMRAESERRESSVTVSRRGILSGLIGIIAAPAIVRAASLMPVKAMPDEGILFEWQEVAGAVSYNVYRENQAIKSLEGMAQRVAAEIRYRIMYGDPNAGPHEFTGLLTTWNEPAHV